MKKKSTTKRSAVAPGKASWRRHFGWIIPVLVIAMSAGYLAAYAGMFSQPTMTKHDSVYVAKAQEPKKAEKTVRITTPERIIIPRLGIGIAIDDSTIDTQANEWPLSDDKVHFANFTAGLGSERGTLLLYGHNTMPVLWKTNDIRIGDTMTLVDEEKKSWKFELYKQQNVRPKQVGFIFEDVPFRVVMFTCNGWNDEFRRLMYFKPA